MLIRKKGELKARLEQLAGRQWCHPIPVARKGRVLLFPAEDSLPVVYQRLSGISRAAGSDLTDLEIHVITEPRILLDSPAHQKRLADTIERVQPDLLILDPFIRLHGIDENNAAEVAPLLAYLRELQRRWHMAIVLVHHARKNAGTRRPGQALRGSSDLHGWGDSNLYLRRTSGGLTLTTEHRAAAGREDISLQLNIDSEGAPSLALSEAEPEPAEPVRPDPRTRIMEALARQDAPLPFKALRQRCHIRTATLSETLGRMTEQGCVISSARRIGSRGGNRPERLAGSKLDGGGQTRLPPTSFISSFEEMRNPGVRSEATRGRAPVLKSTPQHQKLNTQPHQIDRKYRP